MLNIRKIGAIGRTYRHLGRYRQILTVLIKYGFDEFVNSLNIEQYLEISMQKLFKREPKQVYRLTRPERVRHVLEELGPTFIKFGQILSTRPDLIPLEYIKELSRLQDKVPSFSFDEVRELVENELNMSLEAVFQYFDTQPLAAASIGQVHKARLHDNTDVVVKVQRPGIKGIIETDLEIMLHLASLMERHLEDFEIQRPTRIVSVFAASIEKEINYTLEASNMRRFARQFRGEEHIYIPRVYDELSTRKLITMEYVRGIKASNTEKLAEEGYDLKLLARQGAVLTMKQVFVSGFFHADTHPGNIFILPGNVICYLDFGMMGRITRKEREDFADLVMYVALRDERRVVDALLKITYHREYMERTSLESDIAELIDSYVGHPLKELEVGPILQQLLEVVARHQLSLKPNFYLLVKTAGTVEGIGRLLDPDFDIIGHAEPFIRRIQKDKMNPRRMIGDMVDSGSEFIRLLKDIPAGLKDVLALMKEGRIKIEFEHRGLEPFYSCLDRISNRIAFAIVLAAQIVGSSLIVLAGVPPKWYGIPVIGLIGFLFAGIMGFWLLVSILRHNRM